MSALDSFAPLDDLIQVIYHISHRFVLLSKVDFIAPAWHLYLGLADEGRWWRGQWIEKDIHELLGKNASVQLLEAFANKIAATVTEGELRVDGWSTEKDAQIKIIFGTTSDGNKPLLIPLSEMTQTEAAVFVVNEFLQLGLNAQSRKCRLNPPVFATFISAPDPVTLSPPAKKPRIKSPSPPVKTVNKSQDTKLESKAKENKIDSKPSSNTAITAAPKTQAALGPRKKSRKVERMEFGSDD